MAKSKSPAAVGQRDLFAEAAGGETLAGLLVFLKRLRSDYDAGRFGPTVHEAQPNVKRDSRVCYLYFTLAPSLNFQRRSETMWLAALRTFEDGETSFVYYPENSGRSYESYKRALSRHGLATLRDRHTSIWLTISQTLASDFKSDPRVLLRECDYDVVKLKRYVTTNRKQFPYLSGPKLLNYWLYMLSCFTPAPLRNREAISIIPDVHITRATERLGFANRPLRDAGDVEQAWSDVLAGTGIAPCDLHGPLWRWSRLGFPEVNVS